MPYRWVSVIAVVTFQLMGCGAPTVNGGTRMDPGATPTLSSPAAQGGGAAIDVGRVSVPAVGSSMPFAGIAGTGMLAAGSANTSDVPARTDAQPMTSSGGGSASMPAAPNLMMPVAGSGGAAPGGVGGAAPRANAGGAAPPLVAAAGNAALPVAGGAAPAPPSTPGEPTIPEPKADCPRLATGSLQVMGARHEAWVGQQSSLPGPLVFYFHNTGSSAAEAPLILPAALVADVMASGGAIFSLESGGQGGPLEWGVYTTGDFEIVDEFVACAVKQLKVDTKRIYASGSSAGGLAAGALTYARSSYIAATLTNSGGIAPWPGLNLLQDPSHVPAIMTMHGAAGVDVVVLDFGDTSRAEDKDIVAKGGFAVDCDHGGVHIAAPDDLKAAGWEFLKAHPFGTKPSPYAAGLPASFPKYCMIVK